MPPYAEAGRPASFQLRAVKNVNHSSIRNQQLGTGCGRSIFFEADVRDLLDDFVRHYQQRLRNLEAQRIRGLTVDD